MTQLSTEVMVALLQGYGTIEDLLAVSGGYAQLCDLRNLVDAATCSISIVWSRMDIEDMLTEDGILPSGMTVPDGIAMEILQNVEKYHDASMGVSYENIRQAIGTFGVQKIIDSLVSE